MNEFMLVGTVCDIQREPNGDVKLLVDGRDGANVIITVLKKDEAKVRDKAYVVNLLELQGAKVLMRGSLKPLKVRKDTYPEAPQALVRTILVITYESLERSFKRIERSKEAEEEADACPF